MKQKKSQRMYKIPWLVVLANKKRLSNQININF